jgi:hypothetical protein
MWKLSWQDARKNSQTNINSNLEHLLVHHWHQHTISKSLRVNTTLKFSISNNQQYTPIEWNLPQSKN